MIIRLIEKNDINKGLIDLLKQVWFITEINDEVFEEFLNQKNFTYVVELDGKIIGCASLILQKKLIRNGGIAGYIEDVVIHEDFRNKKIGQQLVQKLVEEAKYQNCYKVILSCFTERVSFYERVGFYNESITMRIDI